MLLQGYNEYLTVYVLLAIIMFILGILLTSWRAKKFDYDTSIKPNLILNAFWALIIILLFFILVRSNPTFWANLVFKFLVDLFIGALIASLVYHESYSEMLRFLIVLVIILLVFYVVIAVALVILII